MVAGERRIVFQLVLGIRAAGVGREVRHADVRSTRRYARLSDQELIDVIRQRGCTEAAEAKNASCKWPAAGARDGIRTRDNRVGNAVLYQLSYSCSAAAEGSNPRSPVEPGRPMGLGADGRPP
jgi:hypothetical protein